MSIDELKEGIKAPDFKLMGSDDKEHSLSDYLGKKVIVYFYPKDNTPGCTIEANDFSDNIEKINELNAVVLGISRDSLSSHKNFCNKFSLTFTLLSDEDENVCKMYDVIKEKNMYGKKSIGIERSTFIIDEQGIIKKIFRKVKVNEHVEDIIKELNN
ncbi:thioredoxin-dependent thiol peroxidase [Candidatus Clostridium stratigraminis]|uniref:thioredoxin-dependent peroxiredoxin n=1 Tax=Candidatus Clostridium stratigraminis TaxID=3381661 RepID=A0ABW8TAL8_9CLOT